MTPRMNLVPRAFQRRLLVRRRIRQWFPPCVAALLLSLTAVGEVGYRLRSLSLEARSLEDRLRPMNEMTAENDRIAERLKMLVRHESVLHEIVGVQRPISLLAVISGSAGRSQSRLQIQRLTVQQVAASTPGARQPAEETSASTEITIHGVAMDDSDVAAFVQSLKDSQAFTTVDLKSTTGILLTDVPVRQYDVSCRR